MINSIFSTIEELIMAVLATIALLSTLLCFIQNLSSKETSKKRVLYLWLDSINSLLKY
ncbi:hypothetical protein BN1044_04379 [Hafnia alvei]|uniref:Uncharacterized protein n=1 Tax=Hafnia alvei TaxID=569 RepID=A0A1C6Z730_HAFAL|nr:hypothetical protein BN1044_04379 [Hafnia alvei]